MKISEIVKCLNARVLSGGGQLDRDVDYAFSSDLMSDVLTIEASKVLLITGLCNIQTIRTAEMSFVPAILFVRNKKVTSDMLNLANENKLIVLEFEGSMFKASGILYKAGLKPVY